MIFDRTQNDVDTAIILRREKVQTFQELFHLLFSCLFIPLCTNIPLFKM